MSSSGLTATGLVIELIDDIRSGLQTDLRNTFFSGLPLGDQDLLGHIVGIIANELGLLWERLEQVYSSQDPDKATGPALDALSALTGTFRQPATKSSVTLVLCGDPSTTINSGSVVQTASSQENFDTQDTVTTVALTAWAGTTSYVVGNRVTNAARCYQCIVNGTSAGSGGPTTTASDITDGTVHWEYIGEGTAAIDVFSQCEITGPIQGTAGDITSIQTPVTGWKSARNLVDATLGNNESTDEELRLLRQIELAGSGSTTRDALRAQLLKVLDVISATVFVNNTDITNGDGLPPHSFEALVRGGDVQDIVNTIAQNQAAGIATYSSAGTFGTYTDSEGNPVTIYYTRPTNVNIYVDITVTYDVTLYPSDGDAEVQAAILAWGNGFPVGRDVDASAVGAQAFQVAGVLGATQVLIYTDHINPTPSAWTGTHGYNNTPGSPDVVTNDGGRVYVCITSGTSAGSGGPTGTGTDITDGTVHWRYLGAKLVITSRQLAVFDSTRVAVHSSAVTP
jgi:uncharacterized phage protein gp47/JayE